jgi:quercetin dioxygenase-like cupin family protein
MAATDRDVVRIGALALRFLVDETQSSGDLVVFEFAVPADARVPVPHYHERVDEMVYGLEGRLATTVDGRARELGPGDSLFIPRGSVHQHENRQGGTARALIVLAPGSIGRRYFEEVAEVVNGPGPPDPARVRGIMLRHGLVPA